MKRRWDALDIVYLLNAALDGFAQEFYNSDKFSGLTKAQRTRVLTALGSVIKARTK